MDQIEAYFADMPTVHRAAVLFGGLAIFFIIENTIPLFKNFYNKTTHTATNVFFTLTTVAVNFVMAFILVAAALWVEKYNFGILNWIGADPLIASTFGLMMMDFSGAWLPHYIEHKIKWMWQFHVIHHTDQNVDTTTANRHHPGESVIRFLFTTAAVFVVGAPMWLIFLYQTASVVLTQFNHSNLNMPSFLDKLLRIVFCTPNMHRIHHHYRQPYSDTNFGNIFSFWDRIFGTFVIIDNTKLVYGVDTYMDKKEASNIISLLKIPFIGYRDPIVYDNEDSIE
ncbi:MAG: sterol desaturase family protein [Saprospiraceae bacterium]|nr:sterol desaturase family protein [Saprospiraceae bacterium]